MKKLLLLMGVSVVLSGCGKEAQDQMNAKYDESFRTSCTSSSEKAGASKALSTQLCDCALTEINKRFSATEKLTMSGDDAKPIVQACLNKAVK